MLEVFKTVENTLKRSTIEASNTWISLTNPTREELSFVQQKTGALIDFMAAALDSEESSRIEEEDDQILVIVNASIQEDEATGDIMQYTTIPIGIIVMPEHVITITLAPLPCLEPFKRLGNHVVKTEKKTRFTLQIIYQMATSYLNDLKAIDRKTDEIETRLYAKMEDDLFLDLLKIEKTLVYFRNSLRGNGKVLKKLFRTSYLKRYEEDEDLLEDAAIELQQAMEMADTSSSIIRSVRDGVASLMSNKLNETMKTLAGITIILTIPTMIFSFYGMNVYLGETNHNYYALVIIIITVLLTGVVYLFMKKRNLF